MALIHFELTEQHIALCKHVDWTQYQTRKEGIDMGNKLAIDHMHDEFGLILFGKPDGEFDPTSTEEPDWSDEQKEQMDKYFEELPRALEIILHIGSVETGMYGTKHYDLNWKKSNK